MRQAWITAMLTTACFCAGCGMFGHKRDQPAEQPKPAEAAKPASQQRGQTSDWGARIGGSAYEVDQGAIEDAGISSHSDRIGAGQIDQLKMAGPSSAPKIAAFLADPSPVVRAKAVAVLTGFGPEAEAGLPKVAAILRDVKPELRLAAAQAMAGIRSPKTKGNLEQALKDPSPAVQAWARAGLVLIGGDCEEHQVATARILGASLGQTPGEAARAMAHMNCAAEDAIDALIKATGANDEHTRAAAARGLGQIGPRAARSVPALIRLLSEKKAFRVRLAAMLALARMGPKASAAVGALIPFLKDPAPRFRELAAHALGAIGPAAHEAIGPLAKATRDTEATVQVAAKKALAAIEKPRPTHPER